MRFQDELITSFRSISAFEPRRYLVRQMADLPVTFDFQQVIECLRGEERRADSPLWPSAAAALNGLQPRTLPTLYGFDPKRDLFKQYTDREGAKGPPAASWISVMPQNAPGRGLQNEVWIGAGCHLLEECLDPLFTAARSGSPARQLPALRCLARFLHHRARQTLKELAPANRLAALALALTGDPDAEPVLLEVLQKGGGPRADLVALLGRFPSRDTARELKRWLKDSDGPSRTAAAIALEGFADFDPVGLAKPLMRAGETRWPLVHLADSLGRAGTPDAVDKLIHLYNLTPDPLAQVAIVRSIANLGGRQAAPFLLSLLDGSADPVKAVAVEGLVQVRTPAAELAPRLLPLLDSAYPRLAANALVALTEIDPGDSAKRLVRWLKSDDDVLRLEGAFILGYLRSPNSLKVTARFARTDPAPIVRMEHLRALSKYPPAEAAPLLEASLPQPDPQSRARAIRLWVRTYALPTADATAKLIGLARTETDAGVQAAILDSLGLLGEAAAAAACTEKAASPDDAVAAAAIQGVAATGVAGSANALARRADGASPSVRARVAVGLWALGDLRAKDVLTGMLAGDDASLTAGCEALEEICLLLPSLPASPRHGSLNTLLTNHVKSPGYEAFSRERLGIKPAVRPSARAFKDADQSEAVQPERSDTPAAVAALEELDRSGTFIEFAAATGNQLFNRIARLPLDLPEVKARLGEWPAWLRASAAAAILAIGAWTWSSAGSAGPSRPPPPDVATLAPGQLLVIGLAGKAAGGAPGKPPAPLARGSALNVPCRLVTEKGAQLTAAGQLGQNRIVLDADSSLTVKELVAGKDPASYRIALADLSGACRVNFSTGDPTLALELPGTRLEAKRCVAQLEARGKTLQLKVDWGTVELARAGGNVTVAAGTRLAWEAGQPPPDGK